MIDGHGHGRALQATGPLPASFFSLFGNRTAAEERLGINTTAWTVGSTLLSLGLSVGQAMGTVIGATIFIALLAVGAGWMGSHQYIGFTVTSRR